MKTNSLANWLLEDNLVEAQKYITESSEEKTEKESGKEEKGEKEEKEELEVDVKKLIKLIAKLDKYAEKLEDETLEKLVGEFEKLAGIEKEEDELKEAKELDDEVRIDIILDDKTVAKGVLTYISKKDDVYAFIKQVISDNRIDISSKKEYSLKDKKNIKIVVKDEKLKDTLFELEYNLEDYKGTPTWMATKKSEEAFKSFKKNK